MNRIPVVIESPYAGPPEVIEQNLDYLRACMHDSIVNHNEAPFASHGLYTQPGVLRDEVPLERKLGIEAGFVWGDLAQKRVVYMDRGITSGMQKGIDRGREIGQVIEYRLLR